MQANKIIIYTNIHTLINFQKTICTYKLNSPITCFQSFITKKLGKFLAQLDIN